MAGKDLPGQGNSRSKGGTVSKGRESARNGKTPRVAGSKAVVGLVVLSWAQGPTFWHLEMYRDSIGLDNDSLGSKPHLLAADTTAVPSTPSWNAGPQGHRPSPGGLSGHDDHAVAVLLAFHRLEPGMRNILQRAGPSHKRKKCPDQSVNSNLVKKIF